MELAAFFTMVETEGGNICGSDILAFVDNSAAPAALVTGKSGSSDMENMAQFIHLQCWNYDLRISAEYVESVANWADGTNRNGAADD